MMTLKNFRPHGPLTGLGLSLLLAATAAMAQVPITASGSTGIDNSGDARKERAACLQGRSQEDQATCLRKSTMPLRQNARASWTTAVRNSR